MINPKPTAIAEPQSRADQIVDQIHKITKAEMDAPSQISGLLHERRRTLQDDMTWQPCTSPGAALLKLMLIEDEVQSIVNFLPDDKCLSEISSISRLCGSLIRWAEKEFGVARADYGLEFFHTDQHERSSWALDLDDDGEIPS